MTTETTPSTRGFLTQAIYNWIEESHNTAYLVVNAMVPGTVVPEEHIKEGRILFNISSKAVRYLEIDPEYVSFTAKFNGEPMNMFVPIQAVVAVYAKENGRGLFFEQDGDIFPPPRFPRKELIDRANRSENSGKESQTAKKAKPALRIVK